MRFGYVDSKARQEQTERHDMSTSARMREYLSAPTKRELYEMLAEAVRNTAALPVDRSGDRA